MTGELFAREAHAALVRRARLAFFEGEDGPAAMLPGPVLASWQRCRREGMDHRHPLAPDPLGRAELTEARERGAALLGQASGIMEHLFEQIRGAGSMVILADARGTVLHSLGDPDFVGRAQGVALRPGACWDERLRGTNAIGTALVERVALEVLGGEHFLDRNAVLTCSAAPIRDPHGRLAGVLDISGDYRSYQRHTLGLARLSAQMLEQRLFEAEFGRAILVALHERPECVGSLKEGLLAVSAEGALLGANPAARQLLGLEPSGPLVGRGEHAALNFSELFRPSLGSVMDRAARDPQTLQALETRAGARLYARVRGERPRATKGESARPAAGNRLAELATGDTRLQQALDRATRVLGKDIPLLIQGESGVGKEVFARAFHQSGPRARGPFVALNCAAIPESLIESELFGYVGGAFTGARREGAPGKLQQAHGGTLFLDEIGDMPLGLQARLLRVLQERVVTPVGGCAGMPVDISLVCATHRQLREAVRGGRFREDLYYRINGLCVTLPALRERSDLPAMVERLLRTEAGAGHNIRVGAEAMAVFRHYPWPGNVRQLQNTLRVALALLDPGETEIRPEHLPEDLLDGPPPPLAAGHGGAAPACSLDDLALDAVARALRDAAGNVSAAARQLGVSRNTLYRKLRRMEGGR